MKPNLCGKCDPPLYTPCAFWALYFDGAFADGGVDAFRAGLHKELGFEFELFPLGALPGP